MRKPKRRNFDPLAHVNETTWLVVQDRLGAIMGFTELPPRTDLTATLTRAHVERTAAGWICESDCKYGFFFCHRDGVRIMVGIQRVRPGNAGHL